MELILLSGVATLGLLVVHLLDYLLEPPLRNRPCIEVRGRTGRASNAVPAASLEGAAKYDQAA